MENQKNTIHSLIEPFITVEAIFKPNLNIDVVLDESLANLAQQLLIDEAARAYTFKADGDLNLKVGDYAVVHANNRLTIVQISAVHAQPQLDPQAEFEYKWVVDKINLQRFITRHKQQQQAEKLYRQMLLIESKNNLQQRFEQASSKDAGFAAKWQSFAKKMGLK